VSSRDCISAPMRACVLVALALLTMATAEATEDVRWRAFDQGDGALLAISDTDEATDHFGLPLFSCKKGLGFVEIEGEAKENLRIAVANLIRADETPLVQVLPDVQSETNMNTIELFFTFIDGWRYRINLSTDHGALLRLRRDGVLDFKVAAATVHEEFKIGLESVGKFLDLCKSKDK
jgi:hypothetical protein